MLFLVQRPGDFITAEWELLFSFCHIFLGGQKFHNFLTQKKKKRFCGRPTGHTRTRVGCWDLEAEGGAETHVEPDKAVCV